MIVCRTRRTVQQCSGRLTSPCLHPLCVVATHGGYTPQPRYDRIGDRPFPRRGGTAGASASACHHGPRGRSGCPSPTPAPPACRPVAVARRLPSRGRRPRPPPPTAPPSGGLVWSRAHRRGAAVAPSDAGGRTGGPAFLLPRHRRRAGAGERHHVGTGRKACGARRGSAAARTAAYAATCGGTSPSLRRRRATPTTPQRPI